MREYLTSSYMSIKCFSVNFTFNSSLSWKSTSTPAIRRFVDFLQKTANAKSERLWYRSRLAALWITKSSGRSVAKRSDVNNFLLLTLRRRHFSGVFCYRPQDAISSKDVAAFVLCNVHRVNQIVPQPYFWSLFRFQLDELMNIRWQMNRSPGLWPRTFVEL